MVKHGDDFSVTVERTPPGSWYAAGEDFDSTAAEITDWYRRTDGNPVDHDYVLASTWTARIRHAATPTEDDGPSLRAG